MNLVKEIVEVTSAIRQENKIKLRWPLSRIVISERKLKHLEGVIKFMCNVKKIEYAKEELSLPSKEIGKMKIYLDTKITGDLKTEALFRELIRKVQEVRRKQKLVVKDRIKLTIEGASELKGFEKHLKDEVGAKIIVFGPSTKMEKLDFEDKNIFIDVEKS
jgi:isoleucyl-tRNA synthetase